MNINCCICAVYELFPRLKKWLTLIWFESSILIAFQYILFFHICYLFCHYRRGHSTNFFFFLMQYHKLERRACKKKRSKPYKKVSRAVITQHVLTENILYIPLQQAIDFCVVSLINLKQSLILFHILHHRCSNLRLRDIGPNPTRRTKDKSVQPTHLSVYNEHLVHWENTVLQRGIVSYCK